MHNRGVGCGDCSHSHCHHPSWWSKEGRSEDAQAWESTEEFCRRTQFLSEFLRWHFAKKSQNLSKRVMRDLGVLSGVFKSSLQLQIELEDQDRWHGDSKNFANTLMYFPFPAGSCHSLSQLPSASNWTYLEDDRWHHDGDNRNRNMLIH